MAARRCAPRGCASAPADGAFTVRPVRVIFTMYLVAIVGGLVYFSVIGLTHH
jgi:hypothetical protein